MIDMHRTEVDGVETIWTDAPGPFVAGLMFRTGRADETLVTSGYTHLIEHLALSPEQHNRFTNGTVDNLSTMFATSGTPSDVSSFLNRICNTINNLPADRFEAEINILAAEQASRSFDPVGHMMTIRFGSRGHGLRGFHELGLRNTTFARLDEWRAKRFTRENAVLFLTGPLPPDLHLLLPCGEKQTLPSLTSSQPQFPCWYVHDGFGGIAVGSLVPRSKAAPVFNQMAENLLKEHFRLNRSLSYSPRVDYEPLTRETAHLVLFADSDEEHRMELTEAWSEWYENLNNLNETKLDLARKQYIDSLIGPSSPPPYDKALAEVTRSMIDWLYDQKHFTLEEYAEEALTVTTPEVVDFVDQIKKSAMFVLPTNTPLKPFMGNTVEATGPALKGRETLSLDSPKHRARLINNEEGVTIFFCDGSHQTAKYADLTAALLYDDLGLGLVNSNATTLEIEPTLWRNGRKICLQIIESIPAPLILKFGARPDDQIPKPVKTNWRRFRELFSRIWELILVLIIGLMAFSFLVSIVNK